MQNITMYLHQKVAGPLDEWIPNNIISKMLTDDDGGDHAWLHICIRMFFGYL